MRHYIVVAFFCILSNMLYAQQQETATKETIQDIPEDSLWNWQLNEVSVTARRQPKTITGLLSGKLELNMDGLKTLPKFLGATDPIRTMQLMPGVQTTGELNSGIYIRGADPGHNQILLNGAPIYNPMHLLGFFSIFNGNHLDKFSLIKSGISPEYGGRLAAVMSMNSRDSLVHKASVSGNIGLISSQGTIALPLTEKSSLYLSARATYVNLIAKAIEKSEDGMGLRYDFQDYNLTYVYRPSSQNVLIVNGYYGGDDLSIKEQQYQATGGVRWHNIASSIQWKRVLNEDLKMEHTAFFSNYKNKIEILQNEVAIELPSDITDIGYKGFFSFNWLKSYWSSGVDYTCHLTNPQYPKVENLFGINSTSPPGLYKTHEYGVFINNKMLLNDKLTLNTGLRYSGLFHLGSYKEESKDELGNIISSEKYKQGELVKYYGGLEPRLSLEYEVETNSKFIFSYSLQRQYMNQVAVSGIGFPTDFWMPVSKNIPPQSANTFTIGYYRSMNNDSYEFSLESYYKSMRKLTEFGGDLLSMINKEYHLEESILRGNGQSYGAEIMIKNNRGKLTGWISYSLGWSWRKFPEINEGKKYPAKHDRRHDFSVVANYELNNKWDFSAVFVYATGNAFTMPQAIYLIGENIISEYGSHNGARMPDYHRLDLSVNYWFHKSRTKESGLNLSVYNAYARKNPIFINIRLRNNKDQSNPRISTSGKSLYSIIPSLSYTFKF